MSEQPGEEHASGPAEAQELHQRARRAIRLLLGRQAFVQVLGIVGGILVARILGPGPLGVFGIALFVLTLAGFAADFGGRTVLIQQEDDVSEHELATCFTLQQIAATLLLALLFVAAPTIASLYPLAPPELAWITRVLAFDLYLRSWRSLSEIRLERELRYRELALADVAGSTGYHVVAVGLVLAGWGAQSLAWATLAGSALRISLLFPASRWPVRFALDVPLARRLLRTGYALQAGIVLRKAPAWVTPTLVASLIGPEAVGLLTWASGLGRKPLEALDNVVRVSLPHFARLQHDAGEVERVLLRYAVATLLACGLWFAVLAMAGRDLVAFIYTERWLPAMPALLLYAGSAPFANIRNLAAAALVGVGRIRFSARVSAVAALTSIVLSVLLVLQVGLLGPPLGQIAGIAVATPWMLHGVRPGAASRVLRAVLAAAPPIGAGMVAGGLCLLLPLSPPVRGVAAAALISLAYVAFAWRAGPKWLRDLTAEELGAWALRLRRSGAQRVP